MDFETKPHISLLYGLHNDIDHQSVVDTVKTFQNIAVEVSSISLFQNEKYDVVKFDIKNDLLNNLNEQLKKFPYTSDFPIYKSHMTIGYVKPGEGEKYISKIKPIRLTSDKYVYSKSNGEKIEIYI